MTWISLTALFSTVAFITLWFWVVRRELRTKLDTVESAKIHFTVCKQKYVQTKDNIKKEEAKLVFLRSQDIYSQSVLLYNHTLRKPQNYIPGFFMGFRMMSEENS